MTYQERLNVFATSAAFFEEARVEYSGPSPVRNGETARFVGSCLPVGNGQRACECCGTQRLKYLYPILPDGDLAHVKWIGSECHKNLAAMGRLISSPLGQKWVIL